MNMITVLHLYNRKYGVVRNKSIAASYDGDDDSPAKVDRQQG